METMLETYFAGLARRSLRDRTKCFCLKTGLGRLFTGLSMLCFYYRDIDIDI